MFSPYLHITADTVLLEAYEKTKSAPSVQILDLDNTKNIRKFQPFALFSLNLRWQEDRKTEEV